MKNFLQLNSFVGIIVLSLSLFVFNGCRKLELDKISNSGTWNPNLAIPLAFGEFGVYDILARVDSNEVVIINPTTGAIALSYRGELFSFGAKNFINLNDFSDNANFDLSDVGIPVQGSYNGTTSETVTADLTLNAPGDSELHEILFYQGTLNLAASSTFNHAVSVSITLPSFIKNGVPVSVNLNLPAAGGGTSSADQNIDLANVLADFTNNGTTFNEYPIIGEVTVTGSGAPINGDEELTFSLQTQNIDFENIKGYAGQQSINTKDSILLRIFQNVVDGYFQFNDPKFTLEVENGLGIPFGFDFNELKTIIIEDGSELHLTGHPIAFSISSPSIPGQTALSIIELNNANTDNIETIVTPTPQYFYFDADLTSNPDGPGADLNFLHRNSEVKINGEVLLPLDGYAYGFGIKDTFAFNLTDNFSDADQFEFIMIRMIMDNGFPVRIQGQVSFLDENFNLLFNAFGDNMEDVVLPAEVDNNGKVTKRTRKVSDIILTKEEIELLDKVKHIYYIGLGETLNGTQEQGVVFYDDYTMEAQISIQIETKQSL